MDIKINCDEGKFKFRVCGILKVENKYLAVNINQNGFFCLPGGHVELGEDTDTAVLREMKEELGFEINIDRMVCVVQNFFKTKESKTFHEIGYYYVVTPKNLSEVNTDDYIRYENDKGEIKKLEFKWFTLDELQNIDFRPKAVAKQLLSQDFKNIIVKE